MKYIVPAITAIIVAVITAWATLHTANSTVSAIEETAASAKTTAESALKEAEAASLKAKSFENISEVPVGTIIASVQPPELFFRSAGDPAIFDPGKSKWAPADNRLVAGSKYAALMGEQSPVTDLRSIFLRGLNSFDHGISERGNEKERDPVASRDPGSFEADEFLSHTHDSSFGLLEGAPGSLVATSLFVARFGPVSYGVTDVAGHPLHADRTATAGGLETRPKNVAVFYYIRIN